jgi:hypothetical protein
MSSKSISPKIELFNPLKYKSEKGEKKTSPVNSKTKKRLNIFKPESIKKFFNKTRKAFRRFPGVSPGHDALIAKIPQIANAPVKKPSFIRNNPEYSFIFPNPMLQSKEKLSKISPVSANQTRRLNAFKRFPSLNKTMKRNSRIKFNVDKIVEIIDELKDKYNILHITYNKDITNDGKMVLHMQDIKRELDNIQTKIDKNLEEAIHIKTNIPNKTITIQGEIATLNLDINKLEEIVDELIKLKELGVKNTHLILKKINGKNEKYPYKEIENDIEEIKEAIDTINVLTAEAKKYGKTIPKIVLDFSEKGLPVLKKMQDELEHAIYEDKKTYDELKAEREALIIEITTLIQSLFYKTDFEKTFNEKIKTGIPKENEIHKFKEINKELRELYVNINIELLKMNELNNDYKLVLDQIQQTQPDYNLDTLNTSTFEHLKDSLITIKLYLSNLQKKENVIKTKTDTFNALKNRIVSVSNEINLPKPIAIDEMKAGETLETINTKIEKMKSILEKLEDTCNIQQKKYSDLLFTFITEHPNYAIDNIPKIDEKCNVAQIVKNIEYVNNLMTELTKKKKIVASKKMTHKLRPPISLYSDEIKE